MKKPSAPDAKAAYEYRKFYFLTENLLKQADLLIGDMKSEFAALNQTMVNMPHGKAILGP